MYGLDVIIALNNRADNPPAVKTADPAVPLTRPEVIEPKEYNRRILFPFCHE